MGVLRSDLDIGKFIKADEAYYGIDRTEGGLGLKIPVRSEMVAQTRMIEAQLIIAIANDLISYCRRTHRGERVIKDLDALEIDQVTAENPMNAGVKVIDATATMRDPYYMRIFLNKTFGINSLNIAWSMCSDESLLLMYMNDLKQRFGNGKVTERTPLTALQINFSE